MATIKSYNSTDELLIDAASKAARVTLYNPDGSLSFTGIRASYLAYSTTLAPGPTPTDVFTISGSATKLIKIFRVNLVSVQTAAGINSWSLIKRASPNLGGTSTPVITVRSDDTDPAETAVVRIYTANPTTLGAALGQVWTGFVGAPAQPAPPGIQPGHAGLVGVEINFSEELGKPIILRSTNDVLALNFGGVTLPSGLSIRVGVRFTEE